MSVTKARKALCDRYLDGPPATRKTSRSIPGMQSTVSITFDEYGVPSISAHTRADAVRALGYVMARDRLFQMDLLRRTVGGELSEVMGQSTLALDVAQKMLGLAQLADTITATLPSEQIVLLEAYADGVNTAIDQMSLLPFEFVLLRYRPEPWRPADSIRVGLYIMQQITLVGEEANERMMTIMQKTLPFEVYAFLTPDEDSYPLVLIGGAKGRRPLQAVPTKALAKLCENYRGSAGKHLIDFGGGLQGSNGWVVSGQHTAHGSALLANDMHLPLSVPNIWYKAIMCYEGIQMVGVVPPGLPTFIAGSNGHVAWGSTNINGDFVDLVEIETDPARPNEYKTPSGWQSFAVRRDFVRVRGQPDVAVEAKLTIWGPVSARPLLGNQVAIHWTAFQPGTVDIGWANMDRAHSVVEAIATIRSCKGPPLNVMLADKDGHIAWTVCGSIPLRRGTDGTVARPWTDEEIGWAGWIPEDELPMVLDPPQGVLVTANQRTTGEGYPHVLGHHYANGYRAHFIQHRLSELSHIDEKTSFELQLETTSDFYEFYRSLALEALEQGATGADSFLLEVGGEIAAWDGRSELHSRGLPFLVRFRELLAEEIFAPYLMACWEADPTFRFAHNFEEPLRALIRARDPETIPNPYRSPDWAALFRNTLLLAAQQLWQEHHVKQLSELTWERVNVTRIQHPLSPAAPALRYLLDMPNLGLPGNAYCVRVADAIHGASMRFVVCPGHDGEGIMHMPCGQSGRPFARHYRDQHGHWVRGEPIGLLHGSRSQMLQLVPAPARGEKQ